MGLELTWQIIRAFYYVLFLKQSVYFHLFLHKIGFGIMCAMCFKDLGGNALIMLTSTKVKLKFDVLHFRALLRTRNMNI